MSEFIKAKGILYRNELNTIKKSSNQLQPVFEAFSNAWESLFERYQKEYLNFGKIRIEFYYTLGLFNEDNENNTSILEKIVFIDNGMGIDPQSYNRLLTLRDNSKSARNKGTGRIQFAHYFDEAVFDSMYKIDEHNGKHLVITLSKKEKFLANNAILRKELEEDVNDWQPYTKVTLNRLLDEKKDGAFYNNLSIETFAIEIQRHFLSRFCECRECMPQIELVRFEDEKELNPIFITKDDIPMYDKLENIFVKYCKLDEHNKIIEVNKEESFTLMSFVQPDNILDKNSIYYVSNGALAQENAIDGLPKKDSIEGKRYLFLLSGSHFDSVDDDLRGNLHLVKESEFKKQNEGSLFPEECILVDKIEEKTNEKIAEIYPDFSTKKQEALKNLDELQNMFLIDEKSMASFRKKVKSSDSDEAILSAIYKSKIDETARRDAELKAEYERLKDLKPDKKEYQQKLKERIEAFTKLIPIQNRTNLTKYVARRKLVLQVFNMILERELNKLSNGERIDEDILHNLIFQQGTTDASSSDLWLINEEYLYYKGSSEKEFKDIEYNGEKIFSREFTEEENRYLNSLGERRLTKRPDVLLFPEEGKCIIIEFKAPDVNVSEHLTQIDFYANLLLNYSNPKYGINQFYGYLIGESIEDRDVRGRVSRFERSEHFNFWFRPSEKVTGFDGHPDGSLYTEIIKFSSILSRAQVRNEMFIKKLEMQS